MYVWDDDNLPSRERTVARTAAKGEKNLDLEHYDWYFANLERLEQNREDVRTEIKNMRDDRRRAELAKELERLAQEIEALGRPPFLSRWEWSDENRLWFERVSQFCSGDISSEDAAAKRKNFLQLLLEERGGEFPEAAGRALRGVAAVAALAGEKVPKALDEGGESVGTPTLAAEVPTAREDSSAHDCRASDLLSQLEDLLSRATAVFDATTNSQGLVFGDVDMQELLGDEEDHPAAASDSLVSFLSDTLGKLIEGASETFHELKALLEEQERCILKNEFYGRRTSQSQLAPQGLSQSLRGQREGYRSIYDVPLTLAELLKRVVFTPVGRASIASAGALSPEGGSFLEATAASLSSTGSSALKVSPLAGFANTPEFARFRTDKTGALVHLLLNYFRQQQVKRGLKALKDLQKESGYEAVPPTSFCDDVHLRFPNFFRGVSVEEKLLKTLSEGRKVASSLRLTPALAAGPGAGPGLAFSVLQNMALFAAQETKLGEMFGHPTLPWYNHPAFWVHQHWELGMGMGKTKVLAPLVSFSRADGQHISMVVFLDSQFDTGSADLQQLLGKLSRTMVKLVYDRQTHTRVGVARLEEMAVLLENALREGWVVATRPRDLHCLSMLPVMDLETLYQEKKNVEKLLEQVGENEQTEDPEGKTTIFELGGGLAKISRAYEKVSKEVSLVEAKIQRIRVVLRKFRRYATVLLDEVDEQLLSLSKYGRMGVVLRV